MTAFANGPTSSPNRSGRVRVALASLHGHAGTLTIKKLWENVGEPQFQTEQLARRYVGLILEKHADELLSTRTTEFQHQI